MSTDDRRVAMSDGSPIAAAMRRVRSRRRRPNDTIDPPPPSSPTPIWISRRTRSVLVAAGAVALALLAHFAPSVFTLTLGGAALALVLSFPVRLLEHVMPRGLAITLSLLLVVGGMVIAVAFVVPILIGQLGALINAIPTLAQRLDARLPSMLDRLAARGLLPTTPERFLAGLEQNVRVAVEAFVVRLLGGLAQFAGGLVNTAVDLFGILFLAVYFLADARQIEAVALRATPRHYRRDVHDLWNAFRFTLSRYLGGLGISLAIQGVLSAVGLYLLDVPYALLLGTWVSITALVPYLGAWIGAVPAVLVALTISPTTALLTALLYLGIQQLEGSVLTPRIQGRAVRVHPILIFLAVLAGGALFGIPGILFAVPAVAVLRVLFDFFRVRLKIADSEPGYAGSRR
jgi:predicted PurR-regulated permease PerM